MKTQSVRKLHRYVALFFSVSMLMSAGSGVLHNVMTRTQPPPPAARPTGLIEAEKLKIPVSEAARALFAPDLEIQAVNIRSIGGEPWYQFLAQGQSDAFYVNASTGKLGKDADETYASEIASNHLGGIPVKKTAYLTEFTKEYINIFRLLPVYRFDADDGIGTRVYVSTMTGSVSRHTDNRRQFEANIFSNVHKLAFIPNKDLRDLVLTFTTAGIFLTACLGIVLFVLTQPKSKRKAP